MPAVHACNPSYVGGWDQEDHGSGPVWANSLWDPIFKITRAKWTGGLAQVLECLPWVQIPVPPPKKKKGKIKMANFILCLFLQFKQNV
jgi:hypothetical protein